MRIIILFILLVIFTSGCTDNPPPQPHIKTISLDKSAYRLGDDIVYDIVIENSGGEGDIRYNVSIESKNPRVTMALYVNHAITNGSVRMPEGSTREIRGIMIVPRTIRFDHAAFVNVSIGNQSKEADFSITPTFNISVGYEMSGNKRMEVRMVMSNRGAPIDRVNMSLSTSGIMSVADNDTKTASGIPAGKDAEFVWQLNVTGNGTGFLYFDIEAGNAGSMHYKKPVYIAGT